MLPKQTAVALLFYLFISIYKSQNDCVKWLESIDDEYPYLAVHNAYHIRSTNTLKIENTATNINVSTPIFSYNNPSLTHLLSNDVVGIEIDINPQNKESGTNDFPVYHIKTADEKTTCNTLRKCLNEINDWYIVNNYTTSAPLLIYINIKTLEDYSNKELELINSIWTQIFDENSLYTPIVHNAGNNLLLQYNDWSNVCIDSVNNKIIPIIDDIYIQKLNDNILSNLNMFPYCDCQTAAKYCVVLRSICEDDTLNINPTNRLKYLYRTYVHTPQYPQWNEYPLIYNQNMEYGKELLGVQVSQQLIDIIHNKYPKYIDSVVNPLTMDQWQYWQLAAYIDSINNNNGKWEKEDLVKYFKALNPTASNVKLLLDILFWKEGFSEWDVLNPMLWAKINCLWNKDFGLDEIVMHTNLSRVLIEICDTIDDGFHYVFSDYPFNWTYFQDFTMVKIEMQNMCDNITITTSIKESDIKTDCVDASELESLIYGIIGGLFALFIIFVIIISTCVYCCVCYKKGGCGKWCRNKCCECCCKYCKCCNNDDENYNTVNKNRMEIEMETAKGVRKKRKNKTKATM